MMKYVNVKKMTDKYLLPLSIIEKIKKRDEMIQKQTKLFNEQKAEEDEHIHATLTVLNPSRQEEYNSLQKEMMQIGDDIRDEWQIQQIRTTTIRDEIAYLKRKLHTKKMELFYGSIKPKRRCKICNEPLIKDNKRVVIGEPLDNEYGALHAVEKEIWFCKKCGKHIIYTYKVPNIRVTKKESKEIEKDVERRWGKHE